MARRFNGNASNYFEALARAPVNALPVTIACWARPFSSAIAASANAINIGNRSTSNRIVLQISAATGKPWRIITTDASNAQVITTGSNSIDSVWQHAAGVFESTSNRTIYLNGVASANTTTANDPSASTFNSTQIGLRRNDAASPALDFPFNGDIADAAIWNAALTTRELALLATGISPLRIRPNNLVAYWPLNGRVGSGEASVIFELDYANVYGTVPVVPDPLATLRAKARRSPTLLIASPYPLLSNLQATRGNTSASLRTNITY